MAEMFLYGEVAVGVGTGGQFPPQASVSKSPDVKTLGHFRTLDLTQTFE